MPSSRASCSAVQKSGDCGRSGRLAKYPAHWLPAPFALSATRNSASCGDDEQTRVGVRNHAANVSRHWPCRRAARHHGCLKRDLLDYMAPMLLRSGKSVVFCVVTTASTVQIRRCVWIGGRLAWGHTCSQGSCSCASAAPSSLFAATAAVIHRLSGTDASASPGDAARLVTSPSSGPWLKAGAGVTLCLLRFNDLPATACANSGVVASYFTAGA